jgi:uncharacterized protein DUF5333
MTNLKQPLRNTAAALTLVALLTTPALAKPPLKEVDEVFSRVLTGAIVSQIYEKCDRIEPRTLKATFFVLGTVRYAKGLGYTTQEIDDYRFDPEQQERLRKATYAFLDANGVNRDDPESYCTLGFAEIDKKSRIGGFLRRVN